MIWILPLASVLLIVLDQWTKHWARVYLQPIGERPIIEGLLNFTYVENRGSAFGLLQGGRWFVVLLSVVIAVVIAAYYIKLPRTRHYLAVRIPMVFVFAGALGNCIDRALNGYVVDMFEFKFITFPVFNVADISLVTGTIVLAFIVLFFMKDTA